MIPPHNIEAEQVVLGSMLISPEDVAVVINDLSAEAFYSPKHAIIFNACAELFNRADPVNLVTVAEHLLASGQIAQIGGPAFLSSLTDTIAFAGQTRHYCRIIRDKHRARRAIDMANRMLRRCYDNEPIDNITEDFGTEYFDLMEDRTRGAKPVSQIVKEVVAEIRSTVANGVDEGLMTGFADLDGRWNGLHPGELTVLAARPGMGKTCLAVNIGCQVAARGKHVLMFSLEMQDRSFVRRMISAYSRVSGDNIRKGLVTDGQLQQIEDAGLRIGSLPIMIDDASSLTINELMAMAKLNKIKHGLDLIIIDYLQLLSAKAENRTQEVSMISRRAKVMSKELDVPVILVSQLSRALESRTDKRPLLSDLRESGAIEQDADVVAFIYRDDYYNPSPDNPLAGRAEVITAKQRNGPTGKDTLWFRGELSKFETIDKRNME